MIFGLQSTEEETDGQRNGAFADTFYPRTVLMPSDPLWELRPKNVSISLLF